MNKTVLGVIALVIVLGLIAYFAMGNKQATAPENGSTVQSQSGSADPATPQSASNKSLKELVAAGGSTKCTFSDSGNSGTFYVSGGKARGDFSVTANNQTMSSHMILDGQTSYVWVDGQNQGFKMNVDASAQATAQVQQAVDVNKKIDYSCSAWTADSAMFQLPASVQFMDLGSFKVGT